MSSSSSPSFPPPLPRPRYAVVTGGNKGIGFEICRQLASKGVTVILTARNHARGIEAVEKLEASGLSNYLHFHQLDVGDASSVASLAHFVRTQIGWLDILVNNAGILGDSTNRNVANDSDHNLRNHKLAEECVKTNYYGAKMMIEEFIPLLQLSDSPTIVNVSSTYGKLQLIPNNWARSILNDVESLNEKKIDEVLNEFLKDTKNGMLEAKKWPSSLGAYILSKAALNAYTRIIAKKYPSFLVNSVCPGYVKTDMTNHMGYLTAAKAAENVVRLALLPRGERSGLFYSMKEVSPF